MKTRIKKLLLYSGLFTGSIFVTLSSCKKDVVTKQEVPPKLTTMLGGVVIDQSWINLRNKARQEYDYYFASYYHTRDILKEVDWDHAIVNYDDDGNKFMVFQMAKWEDIPTDARLMVIQKPGGETLYRIRMKSGDSDYASIYSANDKMLYVGKMEGDVFKPEGQMALKGTTVLGRSMCDGCHSGDGYPYPGGGTGGGGSPYPGTGNGGSIWDNNLLGEVTIYDTYPEPVFPDRPNMWDGNFIFIPAGNSNTLDSDPCATFNNLMNDPAIRNMLQQLMNNTTLNRETAFTYNGATFSPWEYGPINGNGVTVNIAPDAVLEGHSHYNLNQYGTFSPEDINALYSIYLSLNNPINFAMVIATPGGGIDMLKIVNTNSFGAFGSSYLANGNYQTVLEPLYNFNNVGTGAGGSVILQNLLDATNSGLRIFHVPNPTQPASGNPCQ